MGLELALIGAALAGTAAQVHSSRQQGRDAKGARREQAFQASRNMASLEEEKQRNNATDAARQARLRLRAGLSGATGNSQTVSTSPLGLATQDQGGAGGYTKLGA